MRSKVKTTAWVFLSCKNENSEFASLLWEKSLSNSLDCYKLNLIYANPKWQLCTDASEVAKYALRIASGSLRLLGFGGEWFPSWSAAARGLVMLADFGSIIGHKLAIHSEIQSLSSKNVLHEFVRVGYVDIADLWYGGRRSSLDVHTSRSKTRRNLSLRGVKRAERAIPNFFARWLCFFLVRKWVSAFMGRPIRVAVRVSLSRIFRYVRWKRQLSVLVATNVHELNCPFNR